MSDRQRNSEPSTSELRHDWLSDRWVIIAPQRTDRPDDFARYMEPSSATPSRLPLEDPTQASCPFCRGHEHHTPAPLLVYSQNEIVEGGAWTSEPWLVRVVPNKFPAVNGVRSLKFPTMSLESACGLIDGDPLSSLPGATGGGAALVEQALADDDIGTSRHSAGGLAPNYASDPNSDAQVAQQSPVTADTDPLPAIDLFQARHVSGAHEVIIESPLHLWSLTQLDRHTATLIFRAYRDRLRHWAQCLDIAYSVVFKNVGQDAGASLVHTHSQLIATNMLPTDVRRNIERMELFQRTQGQCMFCSMLKDELEENVRVVAQTSDFVAFCPFASRLPSLVTILPREHETTFESTSDESLEQLAWLVHRVLRSIEVCYPQAAYNYVLHTAPQGKRQSPAFHWRVELFPRLTRVAGFEWGSDCFINPLPPELAAARLRASFR